MLKVTHNAGFFSCCSVRMSQIVNYHNDHKKLPETVDSSEQFSYYKIDQKEDVTFHFFKNYSESDEEIIFQKNIPINILNFQFENYKQVDYESLLPFVRKYFSPSNEILQKEKDLILKYNIDTTNCIGVYYRGTDKFNETKLTGFEDYEMKLKEILDSSEIQLQILLQSDSAPFMDYMKDKFAEYSLIIIDENSTSYTDKGIHIEKHQSENYFDMKNLLASFLIVSNCKYMMCSSGNCSIWMAYFRGNATNVHQSLHLEWL